ncbi:MAG: ABC transporter substrate-binding protein [Gammaproteobacteria bacterium]|nr:ABC transporter substrate-binding protein [Gammaproteobacteria bacterium]
MTKTPLVRIAFLPIYLLIFLSVYLISSCDFSHEKLRIGAHKWPGYEFMFLAKREGWLGDNGVQLIETTSATETLSKLERREIDGASLTLDEALRARSLGIPIQIVLVFDISAGADAVYSRTRLKDLSELRGARIGVEKSALGALMLHKLLEAAHLSEFDVVTVNSSVDQHIDDWKNQRFDTLITYEPISTELERLHAYRLIDTRQFPELVFDVLAVRTNMLSGQKISELKSLIKSHFTAVHHFRNNPQDAAYRMGAHLGLSGSEVLDVFRGLKIPNETANLSYLNNNGTVEKTSNVLVSIMYRDSTEQDPLDLKGFVNDEFIPVVD